MEVPSPDDRIIAAKVALGQEPSAVVLARRIETLTGEFDKDAKRWASEVRYAVTTAERVTGGSSPTLLADTIADLAAVAHQAPAERCSVVVDITASGEPFIKLLRERKVRAAPVMVADAAKAQADGRVWRLPSRELIAVALRLLAEKRIEVADLDQAETLAQQLEAFRTKAPPKDALSNWRPSAHVDLAQALMVACWWSERMLRPIIHQPPSPRLPIEVKGVTFDEAIKEIERRRSR
jgi:hypothetical protein